MNIELLIVKYCIDDKGTYVRRFSNIKDFAYWCLYMGAVNKFVSIIKVEIL